MYIATPSPHRPATPAPQYDNKFLGLKDRRETSLIVADFKQESALLGNDVEFFLESILGNVSVLQGNS